MKILVTGGSGFIGNHLMECLITLGAEVCNVSLEPWYNPIKTKLETRYLEYVEDITNEVAIQRIVEDFQPRMVFHLAACSRVGECEADKDKATKVNVCGTFNILREAQDVKTVKRVVVFSSSAVYGNGPVPMAVDQPKKPIGQYAKTKAKAEDIASGFNDENMDVDIVRPFNVYGPDAPTDGPYAPVVGRFIEQAKNGKPLTIVGDGKQTRDYIHVFDLVTICVSLTQGVNKLNFLPRRGQMKIYNAGNGVEFSVNDIASLVDPDNKVGRVHLPSRDEPRQTLAGGWFLALQANPVTGANGTCRLEDYIQGQMEDGEAYGGGNATQ